MCPALLIHRIMSTQFLPNDDRDMQIARQIGNYLNGISELKANDDSFIEALLTYKKNRFEATTSVSPIHANQVWEGIENQIKPAAENEKATIHRIFSNAKAWAVAASILIAACIGIYYYTMPQAEMIASSLQQIETVTLDDGSTVTLRPNSSLYALAINSSEHTYRLEGEAFFEVTHREERMFSVEGGNGKVSVLGTRFDLSTWGGETQVYLEEGSINFENLITNASIVLQPGQSAKIDSSKSINTAVSSSNEFTDWMNRELIFANKTSEYVFNELEQEFNITITAPDSILATTLSGGLSITTVQQSLSDLSLVLGGEFIEVDEKRFNFVPNQ